MRTRAQRFWVRTSAFSIIAAIVVCAIWAVWSRSSATASPTEETTIAIGEGELKLYARVCAVQRCGSLPAGQVESSAKDIEKRGQAIKDQIGQDKALLVLARDRGFMDVSTYESFTAAMRRTNDQRRRQVQNGQTVYGMTTYTPMDFRSRVLTQAQEYLKDKLATQAGDPLYVSNEEAKAYFRAHRWQWHAPDSRKISSVRLVRPANMDTKVLDSKLADALRGKAPGELANAAEAALPGCRVDPMPTGMISPTGLPVNVEDLSKLQPGGFLPFRQEGDQAVAYLVTMVNAADEDQDWRTYQGRITDRLEQEKLTALVRKQAVKTHIKVDGERLMSVLQ